MKNVILSLCIVLSVTGCSWFKKPDPIYITKTEYISVTIPDGLKTQYRPKAFISVDEYMSLSQEEREAYLTDYTIELMGTLSVCNRQNTGVVRLVDETNALYKEKRNDSKPGD